ncbi:MAG: CAP domain-containing protein [Tepidisphaeraceae bacterium]
MTRIAILELLEFRLLWSASNPSGDEQQTLELINRMRQNPAAELPLLENSTDPDVQEALKFYNVNLTELAAEWATLTPAPPLAWNADLAAAARKHDKLMLADNTQSHQLPGEADLPTRVVAAGYTNYSSLRESVFASATSVFDAHAAFAIDWGSTPTGIQTPPGHRENIMATDVSELGVAAISGPGNGMGNPVGPLLFTEDFGSQFDEGNPFLLGSVYNDTNGDGFYTAGEGMAGVAVHIAGIDGTSGSFDTTTLSAGGYQVQVPAGTYDMTFSGAGLSDPITVNQVVVGSSNVQQDVTPADVFATLSGGVLTVTGTSQADSISATQASGDIVVTRNGMSESFPVSSVTEIVLSGGAGADTISVDASVTIPAMLVGGGGADVLNAGAGSETLKGGGGDDSILGGSGSDSFNGGAGSDTLVAASGASLIGGVLSVPGTSGPDTISVTAPGSTIAVDFNDASASVPGSSVQSIVINGGPGADSISVASSVSIPAMLIGGGGPDTIIAGAGRTTLKGGAGSDSLVAGNGGDNLIAGAGDNNLVGGTGNDLFQALNGLADTIIGGGGNDTAHVDMGLDSVTGIASILFT